MRNLLKRLCSALAVVALAVATMLTGAACSQQQKTDPRGSVGYVYTTLMGSDGTEIGFLTEDGTPYISTGTCFFVGEQGQQVEYLVTNAHVISSFLEWGAGQQLQVADNYLVHASIYVFLDDDTYVVARPVEYDTTLDVAVLQLDEPISSRTQMPLRVPNDELVGSTIQCVGYPGDSDSPILGAVSSRSQSDATVTSGTISRLVQEEGTGRVDIQTDADFRPGNSGGPMVDASGAAIGINSFHINGDTDRTMYAISIQHAIDLLNRNNISYTVASDSPSVNPAYLIGLLIGVAAVAVVAVMRKRKDAPVKEEDAKREDQNSKGTPEPPKPGPARNDSGYRVQGVTGAMEGKRFAIPLTGRLTIGRNPDACGMVFPADTPGVSGRHCEVWVQSGSVYIIDLGSSHGTYVRDGVRLSANDPIKLDEGDAIWLGSRDQSLVIARKVR